MVAAGAAQDGVVVGMGPDGAVDGAVATVGVAAGAAPAGAGAGVRPMAWASSAPDWPWPPAITTAGMATGATPAVITTAGTGTPAVITRLIIGNVISRREAQASRLSRLHGLRFGLRRAVRRKGPVRPERVAKSLDERCRDVPACIGQRHVIAGSGIADVGRLAGGCPFGDLTQYVLAEIGSKTQGDVCVRLQRIWRCASPITIAAATATLSERMAGRSGMMTRASAA